MRIVILSRDPAIPSTKRLIEAARRRGHRVRVFNPVRVEMHLDGQSANLSYQRKKLFSCDVVIPRIAQSISTYGLALVNQFVLRGVPVLNSAQAIGQARNKMRALQLLSANGIDIPATVMARDAADLKAMVHLVGGVPVLVKLLQGQDRHGMMVCESLQSLEAALEAILGLGHELILQQYVKKGQDLRLFVVGGQVVAAVRRRPRLGRLSHTLNRGARMEPYRPSSAHRRAAVAAAQVIGLEVAAVDMLDVQGEPKVFEVNSSPALL
jgi:ribosomal protein S6--L-glutamate ligase